MLNIKRSAESWVEFQQQKEDVARDGGGRSGRGEGRVMGSQMCEPCLI